MSLTNTLKKLLLGLSATALLSCTATKGPDTSVVATKEPLPSTAPQTQPEDDVRNLEGPAIWKVSDEDTTVYLFGTIHILNKNIVWQSEKIGAAWNSSSTVYFETDMSKEAEAGMQTLIPKYGINKPGITLSSHFTSEELTKITDYAQSVGANLQMLEPMRPWLASVILSVQAIIKEGGDPEAGVENILHTEAVAENKTIRKFETLEEQIKILGGMTDEESAKLFLESIDYAIENPNSFQELVALWQSGDADQLANYVREGMGDNEAFIENLLYKRNAAWTKDIVTLMNDEVGSFFIAVGAAHLSGDRSVNDYLEKAGFTVERL